MCLLSTPPNIYTYLFVYLNTVDSLSKLFYFYLSMCCFLILSEAMGIVACYFLTEYH